MPVATVKQGWDTLPSELRQRIVAHVGSEVSDAITRQGGFTPGVAARLRFADGTRVFVKATADSINPDSAAMHRREARIAAALDDPAVPRLLTVVDDGDWVALAFEHAPGDHPRVPWGRRPLELVAAAIEQLHGRLTPAPIEAPPLVAHADYRFGRWRDFAAAPERAAALGLGSGEVARLGEAADDLDGHLAGETLLHGDLRADQILAAGMRISVVDWPHACIGPAWADLALMVPSMLAADRRLDVATVVGLAPELAAAPPSGVHTLLAAVAGHLLWQSAEPEPPGLPSVRAYQRSQVRALLPWLLGAG